MEIQDIFIKAEQAKPALCYKACNIAEKPKYDWHQKALALIADNSSDKKSAGHANKSATHTGTGIYSNSGNEQFAK